MKLLKNPANTTTTPSLFNKQIFLSIINETTASHRTGGVSGGGGGGGGIHPECASSASARLIAHRQNSLSLLSKPPPRRAFSQCAQMFEANRPPKPHDHLMFSIFSAIFCNWCCLGFWAVRTSVKSMRAYETMQYDDAVRYSRLAHLLNKALLVTGVVLFICYFVWILNLVLVHYPSYDDE